MLPHFWLGRLLNHTTRPPPPFTYITTPTHTQKMDRRPRFKSPSRPNQFVRVSVFLWHGFEHRSGYFILCESKMTIYIGPNISKLQLLIMSGVQSESQSSQVQQQEEEYAQPRANRRPRRRNNLLNKIFKCLCGKKYSSVAAWYTHFKKHDNDTEDRRRQIKQAFDELCDRIFERPDPNDPQITIQDIPTFHEEASHKESSDLAFASICTEWRSRPAQTYGRMDDNIFDRRKYRVQGDIFSFEDLITRRREALAQDVQDLLSEHSLEELYRLAGSRDEFRDYKLIKEPFVGRQTLNFGWDLVKYFKPTFAAKLQVFLYALCCEDQLDLDNWQEWKDFSAAHSNILSFIMPILKQYHDQWLTRNQNFFDYQ